MWTLVVELLLSSLFIASVINQFPSALWKRWAAHIDHINLLPNWGFFAPEPGHTGNHLVYRDSCSQGWDAWKEVPIPGQPVTRWIWNPGRFERKALLDLINGFISVQPIYRNISANAIQLSECYLAILIWVMAQNPKSLAEVRQFAVIVSTGHGTTRKLHVAMISNKHAISRS